MSVLHDALRRLAGGFIRRKPRDAPRWVVVDTETSGLDPMRDRLLAIGGVAVNAGGIDVDDSFEVVVKADAAGNAANIVVHGIGHEAQARGTPLPEALAGFRNWVSEAPLVGFHAEFDRAVLRRAFALAGLPAPDAPWLDVAPLATVLVPPADRARHGHRSLDDWLAAFGIECTIRHNAAADALATAELLLRLRVVAARQGVHGYTGLFRVARQQKWLAAGGGG